MYHSQCSAAPKGCRSAMQGIPFGDLHRYFDDGTPFGLLNTATGVCSFNPSNKTIVSAGPVVHAQPPDAACRSAWPQDRAAM